MANIYVPNIIITQDYDLINKIMESDYLDTTQQFEESKAILLSTRQNKYVYTLEHSLNFNGSDSKITLKILDTDNDFENKFFNEGFMKMLMNEHLTNYIKNKENIGEFGKYFSKTLNSQIRIYVAYGIGNELANWSNPIACVLFGANVELANNGVRTYTYEFLPEVNYFFRYQTIEADKFHPNENISLAFGGGYTRTLVEQFVPKPDYKKVSLNIKSVLTKFAAKVTNVKESNVIALIPDIDEKNFNVSPATTTKTESRVTDALAVPRNDSVSLGPGGDEGNPFTIHTNEDLKAITFYTTNFEGMTAKLSSINVIKTLIKDKFVSTFLKESVLSEINTNLIEEKQKNQKSNRELQSKINELDKKILGITRDIFKLESVTSSNPDYAKNQRLIEGANFVRNNLINERTGYSNSIILNSDSIKNIENNVGINERTKAKFSPQTIKKELTEKVPGITLSLASTADPNGSTELPDWFKTIHKIFFGIARLMGNGVNITPNISYESDTRFLKLFKKHGLIADQTVPCVIIGDRQMVLDYIYKNQIPIDKNSNQKSKFNINKEDPLYSILTSDQYLIDLRNIVLKKKNNSSFNEMLLLDELSIDKDISKTIEALTIVNDIPIFLNNFKNSNVLSYSVKNTENYMTATRMGVLQNRYKTLLSQLNPELLSKILESGDLLEKDGLTPSQLAETLFNDSVNWLKSENLVDSAGQKLSSNVLNVFNKVEELDELLTPEDSATYGSKGRRQPVLTDALNGKYDKPEFRVPTKAFMGGYREETSDNNPAFINKYKELKDAYSSLGDQDKKIVDFLNKIREQNRSKPIIFTNSQENITLMNALLQSKLSEQNEHTDQFRKGIYKYGPIKTESLEPLAETIILMNAANISTDNTQVDSVPGRYMPDQNFILGKITEYAMKYFVEVSLKTLPFFYLSNYRTIFQPAFFYSKKINISNYLNFNSIDFFSGEYRITGFKHVITTRECYSEFLLNKGQALAENLKESNGK